MTPARYLLLLVVATVIAVLGAAQEAHRIDLGYRVEGLEHECALLARSNYDLLCEISASSHPARIADEIQRFDIALLDPVELTRATAHGSPGGDRSGR